MQWFSIQFTENASTDVQLRFGTNGRKSSSEIAVISAPVSTFIMTRVPAMNVFFVLADDSLG